MTQLAHVPAYDAIRTQSEPFAAVSHAFCSSIANPNCPSCTRGLSSASCRILLRRTRLRRFTNPVVVIREGPRSFGLTRNDSLISEF